LDAEANIVLVGEATSSAQALARVPAARPHVVLAGAHLREPDSPEMCRQLLAAMPQLHVLMVGANASQELVASAVAAGAVGVLPHTVDEGELIIAIETAAAGRMVMSADDFRTMLRAEAEAAAKDPLARLTEHEKELFALVSEGLTNAEIARRMHLSTGTVRNYVSRLLQKLELERRTQIAALASRRSMERPFEGHG
jgi:DNA-binding NarL/FixJ family response regulator